VVASYYRSAGFRNLRSSTVRVYQNIIERVRERDGDKIAAYMEPRHVRALMSEKAETPDAAKRLMGIIPTVMTPDRYEPNRAFRLM
jgi:hypothetical protein